MKTAGIICEYNPLHLGHIGHIEKTRVAVGEDTAIVCVMSGNYVQRGDFAVFNKHSRAEAAIRSGADLVVEMPTPYVLQSAEGFAEAGVHILDKLGICDYISFGSESGDLDELKTAAEAIISPNVGERLKEGLGKGMPYAAALQKAADAILGSRSEILLGRNNLLGIEYLKALTKRGSSLIPLTFKRIGGSCSGDEGYTASLIRSNLLSEEDSWEFMPNEAADVYKREIAAGRGPVSVFSCETAMLSRLRAINDYSRLSGATEGLEHRFSRYAASEPSIKKILEGIKTKRYPMSRIRRMLMCACLGITASDTREPPPYIRVLAMNNVGMRLLKETHKKTKLPIVTKPASAKMMKGRVAEIFQKEAAATDFYALAYVGEECRRGGQEWQSSPRIII